MHRKSRNLLGIAAITLATACVGDEKKVTVIKRQWPVGSVQKVTLEQVNGGVEVTASAGQPVALVATVRYLGLEPTGDENRGFFRTNLEGGTLSIGSVRRRQSRGRWRIPFIHTGRGVTVNYKINVPPETELDLGTVNGGIRVSGVAARTAIQSINGGVRVEAPGTAEVDASTVNGSVRARFVKDFVGGKFETVNGPVHVTLPANSSFICELSQINGGFSSNFPLSIRSSKGNRQVTSVVNGGRHLLRIETVNGGVDLTREGTPSVATVESVSIEGTMPHLPEPPSRPGMTAPPSPPPAPPKPPDF